MKRELPGVLMMKNLARNDIKLDRSSILQALEMVSRIGPEKILVSEAAQEKLTRLRSSISFNAENETQTNLLRRILRKAALQVIEVDGSLIVATEGEQPTIDDATEINELLFQLALNQHSEVRLEQVPLDMALNMIEGFNQISIEHLAARRSWTEFGPFVTVRPGKLSDVLETIAEQIGGEIEIDSDRVLLRSPK